MKTKEIDEAKIKAQSIIWCDNSLEEKETMMNNLLSTLRQSVLEEVREELRERKKILNGGYFEEKIDEVNYMMHIINELEKPEPDQVTSLINNLIEEK